MYDDNAMPLEDAMAVMAREYAALKKQREMEQIANGTNASSNSDNKDYIVAETKTNNQTQTSTVHSSTLAQQDNGDMDKTEKNPANKRSLFQSQQSLDNENNYSSSENNTAVETACCGKTRSSNLIYHRSNIGKVNKDENREFSKKSLTERMTSRPKSSDDFSQFMDDGNELFEKTPALDDNIIIDNEHIGYDNVDDTTQLKQEVKNSVCLCYDVAKKIYIKTNKLIKLLEKSMFTPLSQPYTEVLLHCLSLNKYNLSKLSKWYDIQAKDDVKGLPNHYTLIVRAIRELLLELVMDYSNAYCDMDFDCEFNKLMQNNLTCSHLLNCISK